MAVTMLRLELPNIAEVAVYPATHYVQTTTNIVLYGNAFLHISTLQAVAHSSGGGCCHCRQLLLVPLSLSSPICMSLPPYEQLLVAEGSGAMGVVVSPLSLLSSCSALVVLVLVLVPLAFTLVLALLLLLSSLSSPFLLSIIMEMVTGSLAPVPPCEQELTVVGGRCWAAVSSLSSLHTWHSSQAAPTIHPTSSFL